MSGETFTRATLKALALDAEEIAGSGESDIGDGRRHLARCAAAIRFAAELVDVAERAKVERDEAREHREALDRNWAGLHESCMNALRKGLKLPDASVQDMLVKIADVVRERDAMAKGLVEACDGWDALLDAEIHSVRADYGERRVDADRAEIARLRALAAAPVEAVGRAKGYEPPVSAPASVPDELAAIVSRLKPLTMVGYDEAECDAIPMSAAAMRDVSRLVLAVEAAAIAGGAT